MDVTSFTQDTGNSDCRRSFTIRKTLLLVVFFLLVAFCLGSLRMEHLYGTIEPGISQATVERVLGEPSERVRIGTGGEVWNYTAPWYWHWFSSFYQKSSVICVNTPEEVPYAYDSISMFFNSDGLLEASVLTGEVHQFESVLGTIEGSSLHAYFREKQVSEENQGTSGVIQGQNP